MTDIAAVIDRVSDEDEDSIGCVIIRSADRDAILAHINAITAERDEALRSRHLLSEQAHDHAALILAYQEAEERLTSERDEWRKRAHDKEDERRAVVREREEAYGHASRLLMSFVADEHFPENTVLRPFMGLTNVLLQIENATTIARDLRRERDAAWHRAEQAERGEAVFIASNAGLTRDVLTLREENARLRTGWDAARAEVARLRDVSTALIDACDKGRLAPRPGCGVGGMTVEANIKASVINGVSAWSVEEARAALSAPAPQAAEAPITDADINAHLARLYAAKGREMPESERVSRASAPQAAEPRGCPIPGACSAVPAIAAAVEAMRAKNAKEPK